MPIAFFIRGTSFSTTSLPNVNPYFITGLADAESSFSFSVIKSKENIVGWSVRPSFAIELNDRDIHLLNLLKSFFGVGSLRINKKNGSVIYSVQSVKDLVNVIIPHFDKYLLVTNKKADFLLFKSIIDLICKKEHLTITGLTKIVNIKASMNKGLSSELYKSFPNVIPIERPKVELTKS